MACMFTDRGDVLVIQCHGALTLDDLLACVQQCERFDATRSDTAHHLIDFTAVQQFEIGFDEMNIVTARCNSQICRNTIRCAVVAQRPLAIGFARMFELLTNHPRVEIRVLSSCDDALAWFGCRPGS
jgi:hypothetical protein